MYRALCVFIYDIVLKVENTTSQQFVTTSDNLEELPRSDVVYNVEHDVGEDPVGLPPGPWGWGQSPH